MSSINYVHDETGNTFIPATQRPDGTWRKPIRVREGYVPQDEQPLYVSKGKPPYPDVFSTNDITMAKSSSSNSKGTSSLYFEIGNYVQNTVKQIPGLNFVKEPEAEKKAAKKKKKNKASSGSTTEPTKSVPIVAPVTTQLLTSTTDPQKRLRNLRKKLKDIEALEIKISAGELSNPEKEQLEKVQRKDEVIDEIDDLTKLIEGSL